MARPVGHRPRPGDLTMDGVGGLLGGRPGGEDDQLVTGTDGGGTGRRPVGHGRDGLLGGGGPGTVGLERYLRGGDRPSGFKGEDQLVGWRVAGGRTRGEEGSGRVGQGRRPSERATSWPIHLTGGRPGEGGDRLVEGAGRWTCQFAHSGDEGGPAGRPHQGREQPVGLRGEDGTVKGGGEGMATSWSVRHGRGTW